MLPIRHMPNGSTTLLHYLRASLDRPADRIAIRFKRRRAWIELNWRDYYRSCESAGLGLAAIGVQRGDRVAILSNTRWEWAAVDMGILGLGAVTVPIYQSYKPDELEFVLRHSESSVLVLEDAAQLKKWESIARRCPSVKTVVIIDGVEGPSKNILPWDDFLKGGEKQDPQLFKNSCADTAPKDLATIVYTSGTTGEPKGVMLSHEQIMSEVEDVVNNLPISMQDSTLTFLPYAHVAGRTEMWLHLYLGFTLNFAESIDRLRTNLAEVKPTVILGVPRVFEKIYAGILTQLEGSPLRKKMFGWLNSERGFFSSMVADKLIFANIRKGLGGRLRFVVSGGAPLEKSLADFFDRAGILLLEAYGLSETTAAITLNTPANHEFGTVGAPLTDVDVQIAEDGEVLVKSKKVISDIIRMKRPLAPRSPTTDFSKPAMSANGRQKGT